MSEEQEKKQSVPGSIDIGGNVGPGAAVGSGAHVQAENIAGGDINIGDKPTDVADAFARIYAAIEAKTFPVKEDAQEAKELVEVIEEENKKGAQASEKVVRSAFRSLARMAPDIWEVAVATFANPVLGISTVIKKIAQKAKSEAEKGQNS